MDVYDYCMFGIIVQCECEGLAKDCSVCCLTSRIRLNHTPAFCMQIEACDVSFDMDLLSQTISMRLRTVFGQARSYITHTILRCGTKLGRSACA